MSLATAFSNCAKLSGVERTSTTPTMTSAPRPTVPTSPDGGSYQLHALFLCVSGLGVPSDECDMVAGPWVNADICKAAAKRYNGGRESGAYVCMAKRVVPEWQESR